MRLKEKELKKRRLLFKKKKIGVLFGGLSSEREVSLKSGACVVKAIKGLGYTVAGIDVGRDVAKRLRDESIEAVFIALHGRYGEDGSIQGLLEIMGIPYTGSGVLSSALAMDKAAAKTFFRSSGISTPDYIVLKKNKAASAPPMDFPLIVKPSGHGSTIGVSRAENPGDYRKAVKEAMRYDSTVIVERFIKGRELTVALLDGFAFPVIEIKPKGKGIFDFNSKYVKGSTEFKAPAVLKKSVNSAVVGAALAAYKGLMCRGAARVDIMLDAREKPYVLEVNTVPGMTDVSLFPRAAASAGLKYPRLVEEMLLTAGLGK